MALPTTNLTFHVDAADNSHVFEDAAPGSDQAEDLDFGTGWKDEDGKDQAFWFEGSSALSPIYKLASSAMLLGSMDFNGTDAYMAMYDATRNTQRTIDVPFNNNAKTLVMSLRVKSATLNDAAAYNNHMIVGDAGGYWGLYLKGNAGVYTLQHYNWDGNEDKVEKVISLNTNYIVTLRHDGTNIYFGLDNAAESSTASGSTSDMTNILKICRIVSVYADVVIGEMAFYDAAITGTDLTDANSYFTAKWLSAAAVNVNQYVPSLVQMNAGGFVGHTYV